jgi:Zn-dependent membrane protease YugP
MRIVEDAAARAAIQASLSVTDRAVLDERVDAIEVDELAGEATWRYEPETRTLTLSSTLFEDDAVPLCPTDERAAASRREVALASALAAATAAVRSVR